MRPHIREMLEQNTDKTWGEMRKEMLPEEKVEVYETLLTAKRVEYLDGIEWSCLFVTPEERYILRLKPAKKVAKRYPIKLMCNDSPAHAWMGGYYAVEHDEGGTSAVDFIYACGKTPVWHFADGRQEHVFRHHGEVATELSFKEDGFTGARIRIETL
jgi:hypothetical protein